MTMHIEGPAAPELFPGEAEAPAKGERKLLG